MRISDWSSDVCSSDLVHVTDRYVLWVAPYRYRSVTWSSSKLHRCIPMARKPQTARPQTDQKTARPAGSAQPASTQPASALPRAADRIRQSARDLFYREGIRAIGVDEKIGRAHV